MEYTGTWQELALHAREFGNQKLHLVVVPDDPTPQEKNRPLTSPEKTPTARELLQMPAPERYRIMAAQFAVAETVYQSVPELADFDACDTEDLVDATE